MTFFSRVHLPRLRRGCAARSMRSVAGARRQGGSGGPLRVRCRRIAAKNIIRGDLDVEMVQPAIWLRRENVLRCGGPDPAFHYYFDVEMYLRYLAIFPRVGYGSAVLAAFRLHPASKTATRPEAFFAEYRWALEKVSRLEGFEALWTPCRRRLHELDRHRVVAHVLADVETPRWRRAARALGPGATPSSPTDAAHHGRRCPPDTPKPALDHPTGGLNAPIGFSGRDTWAPACAGADSVPVETLSVGWQQPARCAGRLTSYGPDDDLSG